MKRLLLSTLAVGLFASMTTTAASPNWFTAKELYCSPVPRDRHGKTGVLRAKRAARKYKRSRSHK